MSSPGTPRKCSSVPLVQKTKDSTKQLESKSETNLCNGLSNGNVRRSCQTMDEPHEDTMSRVNASTPLLSQGVPVHSTTQPGLESETNLSNGLTSVSARQNYRSIGEAGDGQIGGASEPCQPIKPVPRGINIIINSLHIGYITMLEV